MVVIKYHQKKCVWGKKKKDKHFYMDTVLQDCAFVIQSVLSGLVRKRVKVPGIEVVNGSTDRKKQNKKRTTSILIPLNSIQN